MKQVLFEDQEIQAMMEILDAAVRQGGLSMSANVSHFAQKFQRAEEVEVDVEE